MAKKVIITVIAVVLLLAGASAAAYQFYIKPKYSEQLIEAADKILQDEEVKKILESEEVQQILESENVKQLLESDQAKEMLESDEVKELLENGGVKDISDNNQTYSGNDDKTQTAPQTGTSQNQNKTAVLNKNNSGLLAANTDNKENPSQNEPEQTSGAKEADKSGDSSKISAKDMAEGMKIATKLDIDRVKKLAGNDISSEEKREIMKYVKDTLSDEEIAKMVVLVAKYKETLK